MATKAKPKQDPGHQVNPGPGDRVQPQQSNLFERPDYQVPNQEYVRPGALDFLDVKTRGLRC